MTKDNVGMKFFTSQNQKDHWDSFVKFGALLSKNPPDRRLFILKPNDLSLLV